jgi:hypothetical protein
MTRGNRYADIVGVTTNGETHAPKPRRAVVTCLEQVKSEPVNWLWPGRVPFGAVTILDGDPDLGKSTITIDIAARVTRGEAMPGEEAAAIGPSAVIMLSAEDTLSQTIRPRLDAAASDCRLVFHLDGVTTGEATGDAQDPPVLPFDLDLVEGLIAEKRAAVLIVDPFLAFLDGNLDAHKDQEVRRAMHRLKLLAERTGAAVIVVRHLNKLNAGPAMYRGGGSIGIIGAARVGLIVGRDPENPDRHILAVNKNNLAARRRSIAYTLEPCGDVARIRWGEEVDLTKDDILGHPAGSRATALSRCVDAMRDALAAGPRLSRELEAELVEAGHSERTVQRAKVELGVRPNREGFGKDGVWMVELPAPAEDDAEEDRRAP